MFRVSFLVEPNKLGSVLEQLTGMPGIYNMEAPQLVGNPIINKSPKKKEAKVLNTGTQSHQVLGILMKDGKKVGDVVNSADIKAAMKTLHMSPNSYSFVVRSMKDSNAILFRSRGVYVLKEGVSK